MITMFANFIAAIIIAGAAAPAGARVPASIDAAPARLSPRIAQKGKLANKRAKVRERLRALRAWHLTETLDLDEKTAAKLFPIINRFDDEFTRATLANSALRRQARQAMADPNADAKATDALVDKMLAQQRALWDLQERRFRALRKVLTPGQAAKILVVLPEIDRRLRGQIRRAQRNRGQPRARD